MYGTPADSIVGYTYRAENLCTSCIVSAVVADSRHETTPAAVDMAAEDLLNQLAAYELVDRDDERSFDSDDFPKVILSAQVDEPEECGTCGRDLISGDLPDMIRVHITPASQGITSRDVMTECRAAQSAGREIGDDYARVAASFYQSPGRVGHVLASLASGLPVSRDELSEDISATIAEVYGKGEPDSDLMLDMLGTWALNYGREA